MFGFVYIWRDKSRKRFCIGSHYGQQDDGYVTSTGHMYSSYKRRPQDFRRRILWSLHTPDLKLLHKHEQLWLDKIADHELGVKYYNYKKLARGGNGGANKGKSCKKHGPCTSEHRAKLKACQERSSAKQQKIIIHGIEYRSLREAASQLGISRSHPLLSVASTAKKYARSIL